MEIKTEIIYAGEFEDDVYLDVLSLGKEVFVQPTLYEKYSRYLTALEDEQETMLNKFEMKKDSISLDIRNNPTEWGINKITEDAVRATINLNPEVQVLKKDMQYINKLVKDAKGALKSIDRKGRSLDNAVRMYVTGYWGELTAIPHKMQVDIDAYLDKRAMTLDLQDNKRLQRRTKDGEEKK